MPKTPTLDGGTFSSPTSIGNKFLKQGFADTYDGSDVFTFSGGGTKTVTLTSTDAGANWKLLGDVVAMNAGAEVNGVFTWTFQVTDVDGDGSLIFGVAADAIGSNYSLSFG